MDLPCLSKMPRLLYDDTPTKDFVFCNLSFFSKCLCQVSKTTFKSSFLKFEIKKRFYFFNTTSVSKIQSPLYSLMHGHRQVFSKTSRPRLSRAIAKLWICLLYSQDIYGPRATRFESFSKKSVNMCHLHFLIEYRKNYDLFRYHPVTVFG